MRNIYDNSEFFAAYAEMGRSKDEYMNHTFSKHTMIWIYIVLSVSGNIHMFGT